MPFSGPCYIYITFQTTVKKINKIYGKTSFIKVKKIFKVGTKQTTCDIVRFDVSAVLAVMFTRKPVDTIAFT